MTTHKDPVKHDGGFLDTLEYLVNNYKLLLWYIAVVATLTLILLLLGE